MGVPVVERIIQLASNGSGGRVEKDDMNEWSPLSLCLVGLNICNIFMQLYFILLS